MASIAMNSGANDEATRRLANFSYLVAGLKNMASVGEGND